MRGECALLLPDVEIYLVRSPERDFYTGRLRKAFNVKLINLEKKIFGWSAAKIFFLLNDKLPRKKIPVHGLRYHFL